MELSTQCSLAGMLNKNTGRIVEESPVLVAEAHQLHTGHWEIPEAPGHEPAMGDGLWPHKQHKALQDPRNNEKTPDQKPPLHEEAHKETYKKTTPRL